MNATRCLVLTLGLSCALAPAAFAAGPDVVCSHIGWPVPSDALIKWGTVDDINGYSFATFACNIGDQPLPWEGFNSNHPVVIQNLYRIHEDRFEQIGTSWAKHGSAVVATGLNCGSCPVEGQGSFELTPGCADPYNATANGDQLRTGPRSEIDIMTGFIPMPHGSQGVAGDAVFKRLQVHNDDLDPALNPGARYFVEAQYVSEADVAAGNGLNNVSHREVFVGAFVDGGWELAFGAPGTVETPALYAWQTVNPDVEIQVIDVPDDGRVLIAYAYSGFTFKYTLYNQSSKRGISALEIPYINDYRYEDSFHDIDQHSGEPHDNSDWTHEFGTWFADTSLTPQHINLVRWGTAYSFELEYGGTSVEHPVEITIFDDAEPTILELTAIGPTPFSLCIKGDLSFCADVDSNGVRDNPCQWVSCEFSCQFTDIPFGDMGGPFGDCMVDGTADGNDRFHALNCFANNNPIGRGGYPCETNTPQAYNVDTGGPFGSCNPDGVCDGNDAFAALNAFAGTTTCSCPLGGPAPMAPTAGSVQRAALSLHTTTPTITARGTVHVHVTLDTPLDDLRGYQLHLSAAGGISGHLQLIDISIAGPARDERRTTTKNGRANGFPNTAWTAFNTTTSQMLTGLDTTGIPMPPGTTLATFTYKASHNAHGTFVIDLLLDPDDPTHRTFLFPTPHNGVIEPRSESLSVKVTPSRTTQ